MTEPNVPPEAAFVNGEADASDPANEAGVVLEDLETLRTRAETAEQERATFLDLLKRTQADFENYQKRIRRDLEQERRYAHKPLAADLLPALDNLERALNAAQQAGENGPLAQGVALVYSQLLDALKRHGITPIEAEGQLFDPNVHQAVMQQPSDQPPHTVVQVLEQGYMIHDFVLRPARVVVAAPQEKA